MWILNLSKRERTAVFGLFLFLAFAFLVHFVMEPVANRWQALHQESKTKLELFRRDLKILASRPILEKKCAKYAEYFKPEKNEGEAVAEAMEYLESVSQKDACLIMNIKPVGSKDFGTYKEVYIDVNSEGDTQAFSKFLYDVENTSPMILKVRRFTLGAKFGQTGALKGTFLISRVVIY
jgi:hypothetical protein